ncbi:hypothetical protein U9M48_002476, partial [Paspalum notatum var. saurae]
HLGVSRPCKSKTKADLTTGRLCVVCQMQQIRPSMLPWWSLVPVLLATAPALLLLQQVLAAPVAGLPGCTTTCGGVDVPYPFGVGTSCSFPGFNLTCDAAHSPPRLLLGGGTDAVPQLLVTGIHLHNATVYVANGAILNHTSNAANYANATWPLLGNRSGSHGPFVLSYHHNKFVTLGCNLQAKLLSNKGSRRLITGCSSFCTLEQRKHREVVWEPTDGDHCGRCSGNGCCQAKIPLYLPAYGVELQRLDRRKDDVDQVMQNLVLIGEEGWIERVWCWIVRRSHISDHLLKAGIGPPDLSMVPMVLEFAMNTTSSSADSVVNATTTRCPSTPGNSGCKSSHSSCIDVHSPFRRGYMCRCLPGYEGNPYLVDGCQDINECQYFDNFPCYGDCINLPGTYECRCPRGSHGNASMMHGCVKSSAGLAIGLGVGSGVMVLVLALSTILLVRKVKEERKKRQRQRFFKQNRGQLLEKLVCQRADIGERMIITLQELEKATDNFDKSRELGGGGHGIVYKGILSNQHVVAIKKAKIVIQKEIDEFINEVNHRNIVKLLGCCLETEVPLLVYEFISNGTLYKHLHVEAPRSISWKDRLRIAVETARALAYLHSFVSMPVVHRDIKSPNILLDDNLIVKLSDFGASRYIPIDQEGIHTSVQGTLGYLDPMYHVTGHLTEKSDVYSYGVLLIELLTRKKPVSYRSPQGFGLANHFTSVLLPGGNLDEILDPQVAEEGDGEVVDVALLAAMCVKSIGEERPTMRQIEMTLESIQASKEFSSDVTDGDLLVVMAPLLVPQLPAATVALNGLPGCNTRCGLVDVPYPFGIGASCSVPGFNLTCDGTHDPPRLLLGAGGSAVPQLHVTGINLKKSTLHVANGAILNHSLNPARKTNTTWVILGNGTVGRPAPGPFVLSHNHNRFIVLGCNLEAKLLTNTTRLLTGCSSFCTVKKKKNGTWYPYQVVWDAIEPNRCGRCSSNGCGHTKIRLYFTSSYDVHLQRIDWHKNSVDQMMQNLVLIAEEGWVEKVWCWMVRGANLSRLTGSKPDLSVVPMVLEFAINSTYRVHTGTALDDTSSCATQAESTCKSANSSCIDITSTFRKGYACQCLPGYQGNPYLVDGCQGLNTISILLISRELGGGGHGTVYMGILSSQQVVAIKKAKIVIQKEINEFIMRLQFFLRNIVKLLGCCLETEVPLLVYEFISNGALYKHLHIEAPRFISWKDRLRIAVEIPRALAYLHSFVSTPIVHRDIKSPNILLDDNLTVKLSDFGASRYVPIDQEGIHTSIQGTLGYLDPMYHRTGHVTEKRMSIVMLLTRKKPISYISPQGFGLINHFTSLLLGGNLDEILDPQVSREGDGEVVDVALLAAMCVKSIREERPTMRQVEMTLESIQASKEFSSDVTDDDDAMDQQQEVNHRNIVKLLGCCLETKVQLLVYELISNGNLYKHLHVEAPRSISWKDMLRIDIEVARALSYLHSFFSMPIVHRDIKCPNILLDDNLNVKLSDFEASRHIHIDQDGIHTSLLTRKKPVSYRSSQGFDLVSHFTSLLPGWNLEEILDPQVAKEGGGGGEVVNVAVLAAMCTLPLHSLNFGTIILLPKGNDVKQIQQYRPICLLNMSFKIFTKVVTNRVTSVAAWIDFEKAYDKVRWEFLRQALRMKGFNSTWCTWVQTCVQGGNVGIKVNDQLGSYFQSRKGLRQGDPLSPVLFNIVVDMLAIIMSRAGLIKGVVPHLVDEGLSILQYADDTVLFLDHDLDQAKNMKLLLCLFEQLSGLKINFHKSEIFCLGEAKEWESQYSNLFGCRVGSYPFRYLGIPMHFRKLSNKDWKMIEERIERKLSNWKGKMLSFGGRLVFLNSIPRGVLKKIEYFRSRFFWQYDNHKKKYRLISWPILCQPKEQGGLGVQNIDIQNKCLLSEWLFKLCNEDGIWQVLLRNKYLKGNSLSQTEKKPRDSHFWKSLMGVKNYFLSLASFWNQIRFWEDIWLYNQALKDIYPNLFTIVRRKHATVEEVLRTNPYNVSFRRALIRNKFNEWHNLVARIAFVNLQEGKDQFVWGLHNKGHFSVNSMYKHLFSNGLKVSQEIWHLKIPLKVKIFLWFFKRGQKETRRVEGFANFVVSKKLSNTFSSNIAPVLMVLQLLVVLAAAAAPMGMGLSGCTTRCGGVDVPYPFGIGARCSLPGFNLTCDSSHNPPRLQLLGDGDPPMTELQVTGIYLNNATIYGGSRGPPLVLSHDHNRLVVLGCNVQAELFHNTSLITGCSSFCTRDVDKRRHREIVWEPTEHDHSHCSKCSGNGCCYAKIPRYYPSYEVKLQRLECHPEDVDEMMQNLVVIAEVGWIETVWCWMVRGVHLRFGNGTRRKMKRPDLSVVPMVLEFAMNSTRSARRGDNSTRCPTHDESVCKSSHSSCIEINNAFHRGYVCQCLQGYHGNPYLVDGCQDIDECKLQDSYPCYGECINLPGTYDCHCIRGSHGNASMMHGCVKSSTGMGMHFVSIIGMKFTFQVSKTESFVCVFSGLVIGLGVGSGVTVLVLAISTILLVRKVKEERKRKLRQRFFKQNRGQLLQQLVCQRADIGERMIISLQELEKATNNFDKSRELGGGGHGTVYKGILSSQHVVAIKKAKIVIQKEIDEFINEVNHQNIVKLLGCCLETEAPLLVYEFISNGTLYKHLHVEAPSSISWKDRLRIAIETARAVAYLHTFVSTSVVHKDIKSPNILLDDNLTAKLSDFGASRYIPIDQEGLYTSVQGTLGYLDPMYHSTGHLTEKSDVYSYGLLLIELLTRQKPVSYRSPQGFGLVNHFTSVLLHGGNIDEILDPQVAKEGDGEVVDVALLAAMCVKSIGEERPAMRQVEMLLESIQASKDFSSDMIDGDVFGEGWNDYP